MTRPRVALLVLNLVAAALALVLIWEADVRAYWVGSTPISVQALQRARVEPSDAVLELVAQQRVGPIPYDKDDAASTAKDRVVSQAERVLHGQLDFYVDAPTAIAVPFERGNFGAGRSLVQLYIAGLGTTGQLLHAYRVSKDERFLRAALDDIEAFERVDRFSLVPTGFQWNDHAMASTMSVLAEAWMLIRHRPDTDAPAQQALLRLATRTAERLAKPELFTFRTNHGVMQNLALLQFAAAFRSLEPAQRLGQVGCERLRQQLRYYASDEGVVLEHSSGYHEFGRQLVEMASALLPFTDCTPSAQWARKRERLRDFSALLWRPDQTLPVFGNTDEGLRPAPDDAPARPGRAFALLPVSGYAVWWSGLDAWPSMDKVSQTVVAWSNFPTRAHKHADDMSVLVWSRGVPWITSVGYWPYDLPGYADAQSWAGSNAPHFSAEPTVTAAPPILTGAGESERLRALSLQRPDSTGQALIRRQVIELDGANWLIADSTTGSRPGPLASVWTFSSRTRWAPSTGNDFMLRVDGSPLMARFSLLGDVIASPQAFVGHQAPYVGWNVRNGQPVPAPALTVAQGTSPSASLAVSVLQVDDEGVLRALTPPKLLPGAAPDDWKVVVATRRGSATVSATGRRVDVAFPDGRFGVDLNPPTVDVAAARGEIVSAYEDMGTHYRRMRELTHYRRRLTVLLLGLLLSQELVLAGLRRWAARAVVPVRILACVAWPLVGLYLARVFLV